VQATGQTVRQTDMGRSLQRPPKECRQPDRQTDRQTDNITTGTGLRAFEHRQTDSQAYIQTDTTRKGLRPLSTDRQTGTTRKGLGALEPPAPTMGHEHRQTRQTGGRTDTVARHQAPVSHWASSRIDLKSRRDRHRLSRVSVTPSCARWCVQSTSGSNDTTEGCRPTPGLTSVTRSHGKGYALFPAVGGTRSTSSRGSPP
jgi:hypothetical protein